MNKNTTRLAPGTQFQSTNGLRTGVVGKILGEGGQGAVYEVKIDSAKFALKWYHKTYLKIDKGLYLRLTKSVERGAPHKRFLWPLELVEIPDRGGFGYIMPLQDPTFNGMRTLIAQPPKRIELSLEKRVTICTHIAQSFMELHAIGFCYQDINFGNIFFHSDTAEIQICDNDNVNVDGAKASIYGTRKFMAPEIVRREISPCTQTDLFSMAILFFYVIFAWHPLDGRIEANTKFLDNEAENSLYGIEPLFIFDPDNNTNGPVKPIHDSLVNRWNSISKQLRQLFLQSFTTGLFKPEQRVLEREWVNTFSSIPGAVFECHECGYEHVADTLLLKNLPTQCSKCTSILKIPTMIVIGLNIFIVKLKQTIPMKLINPKQVTTENDYAAIIEAHPNKPGVFGLRNMTQSTWKAHLPLPDKPPQLIKPQRTVLIMDGIEIEFGKIKAKIVGNTNTKITQIKQK